jgi:hypothetical protein
LNGFAGDTQNPTVEGGTPMTFADLKAALEANGNATIVVNNNITQELSGLTIGNIESQLILLGSGTKTLTLNANVSITNNSSVTSTLYSVIHILLGSTLNINGTGTLSCQFSAYGSEGAVIRNFGTLTVSSATINGRTTPRGGSIYDTSGRAITNYGTLTINSGTFTAHADYVGGNANQRAVQIAAGNATINGGTFSVTSAGTVTTHSLAINAAGGTVVTLNGGAYSQGITYHLNPKNNSEYLGSSRNMWNAASGGSIVPANVWEVN